MGGIFGQKIGPPQILIGPSKKSNPLRFDRFGIFGKGVVGKWPHVPGWETRGPGEPRPPNAPLRNYCISKAEPKRKEREKDERTEMASQASPEGWNKKKKRKKKKKENMKEGMRDAKAKGGRPVLPLDAHPWADPWGH